MSKFNVCLRTEIKAAGSGRWKLKKKEGIKNSW